MLGFAQKGGMADLVAAKPKVRAGARRRRGRLRPVRRRAQGLHRPPRRQGRACGGHHPARQRLHRESRAPTSTPKAACSSPTRPCSPPATRARTGRSCARWPMRSGVKVGFDSFDQLRAAMVAEVPALGRRGAGRLRRAAQGRRQGQGGGQDRLSDQGLLPDQPDRPRRARRCSAARPSCSTAKTSRRRRNERCHASSSHRWLVRPSRHAREACGAAWASTRSRAPRWRRPACAADAQVRHDDGGGSGADDRLLPIPAA